MHSRSGEFICAPSIPEAVLINIADLLQRWTSDQLISVVSEDRLLPIQYASYLDEKGSVDLTVCWTGDTQIMIIKWSQVWSPNLTGPHKVLFHQPRCLAQ